MDEKLIYIACPYWHADEEYPRPSNARNAAMYAARLVDAGLYPYNPLATQPYYSCLHSSRSA